MALTKLFDSVLYPPGDIVVDNSGYVIINNPSTGMYAYQWTGSTLSLITSYLVPSVSIYGNRSIYYNGTYLFRIVGSNLKAYTFNGSVFAEVGSVAIPYSSSISAMAVQWGGTQIVINSADSYPFGYMMLFTFSGSFTYYGTFIPSPHGLFMYYIPHQMMYGSFIGSTYQVSDAGYLGTATVNPGPTPGSINMAGGGGGTNLFSKRSVKFYTFGFGGSFLANGNATNRYMDYGGVNLDYDGTYLYLVSNVSGTPKVEKIDITTNPCTILDSITYTGNYNNARVAGRNDLIFVNESSGPYLSVWGAPTVAADFSATPLSGDASLTVNFTDLSTGATSWDWDFGDGGTSTLQNPTHIYTVAGTYTVMLSVNSGAATKTKTNYITVNMVADFTATPTTVNPGILVSFSDTSLGTPTSWNWDFGDGSLHSTSQNTSHTYNTAGTYSVTLIASRGIYSNIITKTNYITVNMVADFTATPTSGDVNLSVAFTDISLGTPTSWAWDFGDGSSHSTVQHPTHTYVTAGQYTVTLIASNSGSTDTEIKSDYITVTMHADFSGTPVIGDIPLVTQFTDLSTGGVTGWAWDFGDGTSIIHSQNPRHYYMRSGIYTVSLTVTNGVDSDTETKTGYITVSPYSLNFTGTPKTGKPPMSVVFTDNSTNISPSNWSWDFGDGDISMDRNPTHIYSRSGNYSVKMTVQVNL